MSQVLRSFCVSVLAFLILCTTASAQQSRIHQGLYRGMPVTYVIKHGKAAFQGDIVLERVEPLDPQHSLPTSIGIAYPRYLSPKVGSQYQIPYVIAAGSADLTNLNTALAQFNSTLANIKFVAHASQTDYVSFNFNPSDFSGECEATVGRAGAVVSVNGSFPTVTFINPTQITVPVTAAQIAKPGAFQVWADNFPSSATYAAFVALPFTVANSPVVSASPAAVGFAAQVIGTTSAAKTVTLTNTSSSTVSLNSIATTPNFTQINTCGPVLNPGKSCTVHVSFAPAVSGALLGSLILTDSAPDSPHTVALSGTADLPLTFGPTKLAFGTQTVGTTSAAKIVTLTNNSSTALSLTSTPSGNYAIASTGTTCSTSLAAKAKCNLAITFTPSANGNINGTVALTNGTSYSPQLIPLSGTGSGGVAAPLTFNPTTLTFAAQAVGTTSATKTITVKNSSATALTLNAIAATADFGATGAATTPCTAGMNLAAGATCKLSISFAPPLGATSTINGAIILNDTASVSEQVVDVKGTAALPLTFNPTSLTFAAQSVATTSAPLIVTLTNNLATALNPTIAGNGEFSVAPGGNSCGSSLAAHSSCTVAVTFTPSAVGTRTGVITVTDSGTPGTQTMGAAGLGK